MFIEVHRGKQSLGKRVYLLSDQLIRSQMSFISSLRPGGNYCGCNNPATTKAWAFKTDLQSLTYWTWGSQLASAIHYLTGRTYIAPKPGLPIHCLNSPPRFISSCESDSGGCTVSPECGRGPLACITTADMPWKWKAVFKEALALNLAISMSPGNEQTYSSGKLPKQGSWLHRSCVWC